MVIAARLPALLLAAALALGGALLPTSAYAGPGDLDRSYGKGGHRELGALFEPDMERIDRGRLVVAGAREDGGVAVTLLTAQGDPVRGFGRRGTRILGQGVSYSRINLAWSSKRDLVFVNAHRYTGGNEYAQVWALTPTGRLAEAFGNGGTVTHGPGYWNDIAVQYRKLLVLGQTNLARLRGDGLTFDATFNNGAGVIGFAEPGLVLQEIDPARRGFFVSGASRAGLEVYRLRNGGYLDTAWGDSGNSTWAAQPREPYTATAYEGGLMDVRDKLGSIVYTGMIYADYLGQNYLFQTVGALLPNGYLDTEGFRNGEPRGYSPSGSPEALVRGKVLVPGTVFGDRGRQASITRLTRSGRLDREFGVRGSYRDPRPSAYDTVAVLPPARGTIVGLQRRQTDSGPRVTLVGLQG
jgi:hypothetical protein